MVPVILDRIHTNTGGPAWIQVVPMGHMGQIYTSLCGGGGGHAVSQVNMCVRHLQKGDDV